MKALSLIALAGVLTLVSCSEDPADPLPVNRPPVVQPGEQQQPQPATATFTLTSSRFPENDGSGQDLQIEFSKTLAADGSIELDITSTRAVYGTHYFTEPGAANGKIVITPSKGLTNTVIKVTPIDNATLSGELSLTLTISSTGGSIAKGQQLSHTLTISDDELTGLPKGYSIGGPMGLRKTFEYDEQGRIARVLVESGNSVRTDTYFYDEAGKIMKINSYPEINRVFTWTGDRITKSENIDFGVVKSYTEYDYDERGNVSGVANYFRQPSGEYLLSFIIVYLYFEDNNLYKALYYIPTEGSEDMTLLTTKTYDNYQDAENPFPMVDILPTVKTQTKLPGSYREEGNGADLLYTLQYNYSDDGRVERRQAIHGFQVETAEYYYY